MKNIRGIIAGVFLFGSTAVVAAGIPDFPDCSATMPNVPSGVSVVLFNMPDGTGSSFANAQILGEGTTIDATIEFVIFDTQGNPIAHFPAEDLWLETGDWGLTTCPGGTIADMDTDVNGWTTWSDPLMAGGFGSDGCYIAVNGMILDCGSLPFDLTFNSADLNGDGVVSLNDIGLFCSLLFGSPGYDISADFFADGVINLADVARLAQGIGASCP